MLFLSSEKQKHEEEEEEENQEALLTPLLVAENDQGTDPSDSTVAIGQQPALTTGPTTTTTSSSLAVVSETLITAMVGGSGQIHHRSSSNHSSSLSISGGSSSGSGTPSHSSRTSAAFSQCRRRIADQQRFTSYCCCCSTETLRILCPPLIQGLALRILTMKCAADVLPSTSLTLILTHGKWTALAYVVANVAFLLIWFPFWGLSFVLTEWGLYLLAIGIIFGVGRTIIRFIAFPGASRKMTLDIEKEFARYAIRMLLGALDAIREVAVALLQATGHSNHHTTRTAAAATTTTTTTPTTTMTRTSVASTLSATTAKQMLPGLWRRAETHRNRVLAVFTEVLLVLYQQPNAESIQPASSSSSTTTTTSLSGSGNTGTTNTGGSGPINPKQQQQEDLTKYGNNRLVGDIGTVTHNNNNGNPPNVSLDARERGRELMQQLQRLLVLCDPLEETVQVFLRNNQAPLHKEAVALTQELIVLCTTLLDFCNTVLQPPLHATATSFQEDDDHDGGGVDHEDNNDNDVENDRTGARNSMVQSPTSAAATVNNNTNGNDNSNTAWGAAKAGLSSILPMLDPAPHPSIFGMDMLRGCVLRYVHTFVGFCLSLSEFEKSEGKSDV